MATTAFSTSTSSLRASQSHHSPPTFSYADSNLTQLPNVDIPFEDLRRRMSEFTVRFDAFLEKGRKRVLEEHNEFKAKLSELQDDNKQTRATISTLQSSLSTRSHILSREMAERSEIQSQIADLSTRQSNQQEQRDRLRAQIAATQRQIDSKLAAQREYAARQDGQAALNAPELAFWETYLGMRFEGAGDESVVRVVYSFPAGPKGAKMVATGNGPATATAAAAATGVAAGSGESEEREATFELKVPESGSLGYEVISMRPRLDKDKVDKVVGKLNETREIGVLLKGMRALFAQEMK